jgi:predicted transcriptional regulator
LSTLGKPLTAKQQAVWDLTRPVAEGGLGKTRAEAAAIVGISAPVVSKYLQACYRKKGIKHEHGRPSVPSTQGVEFKNPEKAAALIDAATEPEAKLENISRVFKDYGLPPATSRRSCGAYARNTSAWSRQPGASSPARSWTR